MKTLGILFSGIFLGAVVYEIVQRSYPVPVEKIRKKASDLVEDFMGPNDGGTEDEFMEETTA
jgi:hypothetical protein